MVSFLFLVKGLTRITSNHELPPRTGQRKLMETAGVGTWVCSTRGIPDWEDCPWHGLPAGGIRTHHGIRAELEIPTGPGLERKLQANKRAEGRLVQNFTVKSSRNLELKGAFEIFQPDPLTYRGENCVQSWAGTC